MAKIGIIKKYSQDYKEKKDEIDEIDENVLSEHINFVEKSLSSNSSINNLSFNHQFIKDLKGKLEGFRRYKLKCEKYKYDYRIVFIICEDCIKRQLKCVKDLWGCGNECNVKEEAILLWLLFKRSDEYRHANSIVYYARKHLLKSRKQRSI